MSVSDDFPTGDAWADLLRELETLAEKRRFCYVQSGSLTDDCPHWPHGVYCHQT